MVPWQLIASIQRALGSLLTGAQNRWKSAAAARRLIAEQLDPLLKAADELQGKLRSLAEEKLSEIFCAERVSMRTWRAMPKERCCFVFCDALNLDACGWLIELGNARLVSPS
jgi:hypothetical protein